MDSLFQKLLSKLRSEKTHDDANAVEGPDDPLSREEDDLLGHAPIAREIARTLTTTPATWSARIGIYGSWGSGKTTVLQWARRRAEREGALTVEFNPWTHRSKEELKDKFAVALWSALKSQEGFQILLGENAKRIGRQIVRAIGPVAKPIGKGLKEAFEASGKSDLGLLADYGGQAFAEFAPAIESTLSPSTDALASAARKSKTKITVFVDDIDRIDPHEIVDVILLAKTVLNIPGLALVLALDPEVTGKALTDFHPGFDHGARFLEKIINFSYQLPEPTWPQAVAVLEREIRAHCDFVPTSALEFNRNHLPRNPRKLRAFGRHLWRLRDEAVRHGPQELNWNLLVRLSLLHHLFPRAADELANNESLFGHLIHYPGTPSTPEEKRRALQTQQDSIQTLLSTRGLAKDEETAATNLLISLSPLRETWIESDLRYHANLSTQPHGLTEKEATALLSSSSPVSWIKEHARDRGTSISSLTKEAIQHAGLRYETAQHHAIDSLQADKLSGHVREAHQWISLLTVLLFDCEGIRGTSHLDPTDIRLIVNPVLKYHHFRDKPQYKQLRAEERKLLIEFFRQTNWSMLAVLGVIEPWKAFEGATLDEKPQQRLLSRFHRIVEHRAARELVLLFGKEVFARDISRGRRHAEHYLLGARSPLWKGDIRSSFLANLKGDCIGPIAAENAFYLILEIANGLAARRQTSLTALANDDEVIRALWSAATSIRLNRRLFTSLHQNKARLETASRKLQDPSW